MSNLEQSAGWPSDFSGIVRLFPLPNLVLFPQVVQPLHIFEPRYCEMLKEAMSGDKLIAMALLEKGWENQFQDDPPIASAVCIGKVISHTPTDDGRHNILLAGMKRACIKRELAGKLSFRQAEVDLLEDYYSPEINDARRIQTEKLQSLFSKFVPEGLAAQDSFKQLVGNHLPLGVLTDSITYALGLPLAIKQQLLAECNVDVRCRILTRCLEQMTGSESSSCSMTPDEFPPKFSDN